MPPGKIVKNLFSHTYCMLKPANLTIFNSR